MRLVNSDYDIIFDENGDKSDIEIINHEIEIKRREYLNEAYVKFNYIIQEICETYNTKIHEITIRKMYTTWLFNLYAMKYNKKDIILPVYDEEYDYSDIIDSIKYVISDFEMNATIKKKFVKYNNSLYEYTKKIQEYVMYMSFEKPVIKYKEDTEVTIFIDDKEFIKISLHIYNKLLRQYNNKYNGDLNYLIGCLMYRYETLGLDNNHASMTNKLKDEYIKKYNIKVELFASAFNNYCNIYCSLFYDLERYFGSIGSFFNIEIKKGSFFCNPPYVERLMELTSNRIISYMDNSDKEILFIYTIPAWDYNSKIKCSNSQNIVNKYFAAYEKLEDKYIIEDRLYSKRQLKYYSYMDDDYYNLTDTHVLTLSKKLKQTIY